MLYVHVEDILRLQREQFQVSSLSRSPSTKTVLFTPRRSKHSDSRHCSSARLQTSPRGSMQGHCFLDLSLIMPNFNAIKRFPCKPHSNLSHCRPSSKMVIVNRWYPTLPCKSKPACCMDVLGERRGGYYLEARGFLIAQQSSSLYIALDKRFFIPGAA